jgi:hypothetical protein
MPDAWLRLTGGQINVSLTQGLMSLSMYIILLDLRGKTHVKCCSGTDGTDATQIPDFCSVDVVAVLMTNKVYGQRRKMVVCSRHLPYDPAYSAASK